VTLTGIAWVGGTPGGYDMAMDEAADSAPAAPSVAPTRLSTDDLRALMARVRWQSERLRDRLAETAAHVAVVEEHAATVFDGIAEHRGPGSDASESARRARRVAAVERRMARAYRAGHRPAETFHDLLRDTPPQ
jgi:hypothetical protein